MRQFELLNDPEQARIRGLNARLASVWTSIPGIIQSFNATHQTAVIQPAIKAIRFDIDGVGTDIALPLLLDCPVQFPSGGGFTLTFPVDAGDECLDAVKKTNKWDASLNKEGIGLTPSMEYAENACADDVVVGFDDILPFLNEQGKKQLADFRSELPK